MWHQFIKNAPVPWSEGGAFADTLNLQLDHQAIRDETAMECATICTLKIRITCLPGQILARKLGDHLFGLLVYSQKPCSINFVQIRVFDLSVLQEKFPKNFPHEFQYGMNFDVKISYENLRVQSRVLKS